MIWHIGHVKTGSTFLQREYFTRENGFNLVGDHIFLRDQLVKPNELYFESQKVTKALQQERTLNNRDDQLIDVVSFERLAGNPMSGGYDQAILARRIVEIDPEAKILLIIREQSSFLVSSYMQAVREGYSGTLKRFTTPPTGAKIPLFDMRFLEFSPLVNYYRQLVGKDNICVLPFEMFRKHPSEFTEKIAEFCGADINQISVNTERRVNAADRASEIWLRSFTNSLIARDQSNPGALFDSYAAQNIVKFISRLYPKATDSRIKKRYASTANKLLPAAVVNDNRQLEEMMDIDLKAFGYQTNC